MFHFREYADAKLVNLKRDTDGKTVQWTKVVWFRYQKRDDGEFVLLIKYR